jgi:threonine dehydrogenase-like Zn-dependent dehydrogenase
MPKMKAAVFVEPGRIVLDDKPIPDVGPLDALVRVTTTTICGTDIHILKGEYPVKRGLTIGHEPVGVIEKLGTAVTGFKEGQRVIAGAITPSGHSAACLSGCHSQDGAGTKHGFKAIGGWKFGNTIDGCQADYVLVPDAMANLAPVPDSLTDEQVLMCPDIMSTGFSGAENGGVRIGDTVAVFAQGPIGLCATAGARLCGATTIIAVESLPVRREISLRVGAHHVIDFRTVDPVEEIMRLTDGRGVDVAIEALGIQATFEGALRVLRPGGTLSSLGVYSRGPDHSARAVWGRPGRHQDRYHALPRREGTHAAAHVGHRVGRRRSAASRDAPFPAGAHRASVRAIRAPARRRAEDRDHTVA